MQLSWAVLLCASLAPAGFAADDFASARRKLDLLESDRLKPGSTLALTNAEMVAYARSKTGDGLSNPVISTSPSGVVKASAVVNFTKVQRAMGKGDSLLGGLMEGDRPVSVTARIASKGGLATVDLDRVEVGGVAVEGKLLDALVRFVLLPLYPDAAVGRPFELGHGVERLELTERGVSFLIGAQPPAR